MNKKNRFIPFVAALAVILSFFAPIMATEAFAAFGEGDSVVSATRTSDNRLIMSWTGKPAEVTVTLSNSSDGWASGAITLTSAGVNELIGRNFDKVFVSALFSGSTEPVTVTFNLGPGATDSAVLSAPVAAPGTMSISAKALTDHSCDSSEWHFVITGVASVDAPSSVFVTWNNELSASVPLDRVTGNVAHYSTANFLNSTVASATAVISADWQGQFNLSHGPCGGGSEEPVDPEIIFVCSVYPNPDGDDLVVEISGTYEELRDAGLVDKDEDDNIFLLYPEIDSFGKCGNNEEPPVHPWLPSVPALTCEGVGFTIDNADAIEAEEQVRVTVYDSEYEVVSTIFVPLKVGQGVYEHLFDEALGDGTFTAGIAFGPDFAISAGSSEPVTCEAEDPGNGGTDPDPGDGDTDPDPGNGGTDPDPGDGDTDPDPSNGGTDPDPGDGDTDPDPGNGGTDSGEGTDDDSAPAVPAVTETPEADPVNGMPNTGTGPGYSDATQWGLYALLGLVATAVAAGLRHYGKA